MERLLSELRSGDSLELIFDLSSYPAADGWALSYVLKGPASIVLNATIVNGQYKVTASSSTTGSYAPGNYWAYLVLSKGSEKHTLDQGTVGILQNLSEISTLDGRSHVKKTLDALDSLIEGKAGSDVLNYQINGRSLTRLNPSELLKWRDRYRELYRREQQEELRKMGKKAGNQVRVRF